jgi:hypothetical protein
VQQQITGRVGLLDDLVGAQQDRGGHLMMLHYARVLNRKPMRVRARRLDGGVYWQMRTQAN